jgi:hypothetical protein
MDVKRRLALLLAGRSATGERIPASCAVQSVKSLCRGCADPDQGATLYYEMDFLGGAPTGNSRESNSYNPRIRQLWFSYDNDYWHSHFSAGQMWSLLTQNRVGIINQAENIPLTIDAQYVTGFNWARQPAIRFVEDWGQDCMVRCVG